MYWTTVHCTQNFWLCVQHSTAVKIVNCLFWLEWAVKEELHCGALCQTVGRDNPQCPVCPMQFLNCSTHCTVNVQCIALWAHLLHWQVKELVVTQSPVWQVICCRHSKPELLRCIWACLLCAIVPIYHLFALSTFEVDALCQCVQSRLLFSVSFAAFSVHALCTSDYACYRHLIFTDCHISQPRK